MIDSITLEILAQGDAALKLVVVALELFGGIAADQGKTFDFAGMAQDILNSVSVDHLSGDAFAVEKRSREIAANLLMALAVDFGQVPVSKTEV